MDAKVSQETVNLSIKGAPRELIERVRERAKRNHRSLQGEVLAILEQAVPVKKPISIEELQKRIKALGISTPSESAQMIREDRDSR